MSTREFRTHESYEAERVTRDMLPDFLRSRGYRDVNDVRKHSGMTESQIIHARAPDGEQLTMRVKLCWRRTGKTARSALQLLAKVKNGNWEGSLRRYVELAAEHGTTHFLFLQREDNNITSAALVPCSELVTIWCAQRDISSALIVEGRLGNRKKNHAMNGSSPTLWLEDDEAPEVAAALWGSPGVRNLVEQNVIEVSGRGGLDDTFDDLPSVDLSLLGSDGASKTIAVRSYVKRDPRVRAVVLQRAQGRCEREGCGVARAYPGFLDVHHILGAEKSDRVWNCVAVCPNCHREAHTAPDRDILNARLLEMVRRFEDSGRRAASGHSDPSLM
jgi:5-methylcytosine-specific restriction enzyme A